MACLRGISKRVNLLPRRVYPLCGHRFGDDKNDNKPVSSPNPMINKFFSHIGTERLDSVFLERQYKSFVGHVGLGLSYCRYMSSTPAEWSDKVDGTDLVATEVVTSQVAPAINEVAIAVADSYFPVSAVIHLINGVHSVTGLNWGASIALTTLIINGLTVPILLSQTKTFHKIDIMKSHGHEFATKTLRTKVVDPEDKQRLRLLVKKHKLNQDKIFTLEGCFFISFTFAIRNMVEKVSSFKNGGALWFTDLSTLDSTYTLPFLTVLTFLVRMELYDQQLQGGNLEDKSPSSLFVLSVTLMLYLENAVYCYWLTSNLFCIVYSLATRRPIMRELLNLSEVTPPSSSSSAMLSSSNDKKNKK